ncbi:nucleotide-binding alpha-beta plait domain-containing protein [Tanacetum coccineum]
MVNMRSLRSKEDDVQKISSSVFVTNFPEQFSAKDLWNTCKVYGHVVDTYIPDRRSKIGKRFGFETIDGTPTMVLDESCLNNEEFSLCLLGKVTEFASLTNLKVVLAKEGFGNIELKYMGGFWVMIVFQEEETMKAFHGNKSVGSWFSQIGQAHKEFVIEERVIWVEIEGVPCKWWSKNTFTRIASRWGNLLNAEDLEEGGYHSIRLCIRTKINMAVVESFKMGCTCRFVRGHNGDNEEGEFVVSQNQDKIDTNIDANESTCSGHFKKSTRHRTGGSIIQLIEDLVNVGANDGL